MGDGGSALISRFPTGEQGGDPPNGHHIYRGICHIMSLKISQIILP